MGKRLKALLMALVMMVTTVISLSGNYVQAKADASDELSLVFHFTKDDNSYDNYYMWIWTIGDGVDVPMIASSSEATVTLNTSSVVTVNSSTTVVNYIVKNGPGWDNVDKDYDGDRSIDMSKYIAGQVDVYLKSGEATPTIDDSKAVKGFKVSSVSTADLINITVKSGVEIEGELTGFFKVKDTVNDKYLDIKSIVEEKTCEYTIALAEKLDPMGSYQIEYSDGLSFMVGMPDFYVTEDFESKYTYTGDDLGATWSADKTSFRVWAPLAENVKVNLYTSGTAGTDDLIEQVPMTRDVDGTWVAEKAGDLNGVYYTYAATVNGKDVETIDPYARTAGVNGNRGMIIDLASTNPEGWDNDKNPCTTTHYEDDIIYELHIRDFSYDAGSGMKNTGKYLAFTEKGTTNSFGQSTGIDYLKDLGITHVHLLPTFDYASVDETDLANDHFNWGYDPQNYNLPEGSYSTDPYNGAVRVNEFKQMVKSLHDANISVVMDVVYGHVASADNFSVNKLTPSYYSRTNSNGSGCGNDTATERLMNRKFIVDSMVYWAKEYHIDGFRIDQVGLFDTDTVVALTEALHEIDPTILLYGEGWSMPTNPSKDVSLATQGNADLTPGFGYFNDGIRDAIKGGVFDLLPGYVTRNLEKLGVLLDNLNASVPWSVTPSQVINYSNCHDNHTIFDRIAITNPDDTLEERIKANRLAASIVMTSQGVPFLHAGEEILRSKPRATAGSDGLMFEGNSYSSPSSMNSIKWDTLNDAEYAKTRDYYKGLIALRKAHPAMRMTSYDDILDNFKYILKGNGDEDGVVAYRLSGAAYKDDDIIVILNPSKNTKNVALPEGNWSIYVEADKAGTDVLGTASGSVDIAPISALVLTNASAPADTITPANDNNGGNTANNGGETVAPNQSVKTGDSYMTLAVIVLMALACVSVLVVARKRKLD